MSVLFYIASDYPLKEIANPHYKTLSVNEALAIGMENIPAQLLEPGFDRDKPDVLLWLDTFVTENELDDLKELSELEVCQDPITRYCFTIQAD